MIAPIPLRWLLMAALAATIVLGVSVLWKRHNAGQQAIGYERRAAEDRAAAAAQTDRMRELQRAAEKRYVVHAAARERFIVETITEVRHATAPLAACLVGSDAVRLLNTAASCARGDSAAACGAGRAVPDAGPAR